MGKFLLDYSKLEMLLITGQGTARAQALFFSYSMELSP